MSNFTTNQSCFFCQKEIKIKRTTKKLINIQQIPKVKYFCNDECKESYIQKVHKGKKYKKKILEIKKAKI